MTGHLELPGVTVEPNGNAAWISGCGRYRYRLGRRWTAGWGKPAVFVMLNPSIADAYVDDPTIRRCVRFARAWGCDRLIVVNLYALRATDPRELWKVEDPVGPENDAHLEDAAYTARRYDGPLVAAWGANARPDRVAEVLQIPGMERLKSLGMTLAGAPKHPLARGRHRIPDDVVPRPWSSS